MDITPDKDDKDVVDTTPKDDTNDNEEVTLEDPKAVLAALNKAKKEAKKYREERDALKTAGEEKYKARLVRSEAKVALAGEGVKDSDRILGLLDMSKVSLDENEELTGLDEEIERVKTTFPELFDVKRRVGGGADLFKESNGTPKSALDRIVAQVQH